MILAVLPGRPPSHFDGLVWAEVQTGDAGGAVRSYGSKRPAFIAFRHCDIPDRTYGGTDSATDAFIRVDFRTEGTEHHLFYSGPSHYPGKWVAFAEMQLTVPRLYIADDPVEKSGVTLQFPELFVGIAAENNGAVVRPGNLVAIRQFNSLFAQQTPQTPDAVAGLRSAGNYGKHIRVGIQFELRNDLTHSGRQIEVIDREDKSYPFLAGKVQINGLAKC